MFALASVENEGILVIGSGFLTHNFGEIDMRPDAPPRSWVPEFTEWIKEKTLARDTESLLNYETLAPHARKAVPRPEHFVPFLIALGSGNPDNAPRVLFEGEIRHGSMSNLSFQF